MLLSAVSLSADEKGLSGTADEKELYRLLEGSKFIEARQCAEKILLYDNDSYAALYAIGFITTNTETNLPKACYYYEKARHSFEIKYGKTPGADTPWMWHNKTLDELFFTLREMDFYEKSLGCLEAYDTAYIPKKTAYYAWPLMQLGRLGEAREKIAQALKECTSDDDRTRALNTRATIESGLGNREESYRLFGTLVKSLKDEGWQTVVRSNYAGTAMRLLKFDEAEKEYIKAASYSHASGSVTNPWKSLTGLYTMSGRFNEACGAIEKMVQRGLAREPFLDQQCEQGEYGSKAEFLLACGYPEQAYAISRRLVNMPGRLGYSSAKKYEALGSTLFFHLMATEDYQELVKERLVQKNPGSKAKLLWIVKSLDLQKALLKPRIRRIIMSQSRLEANIIPYHPDEIGIEHYYVADLASVVGKGPMMAELAKIGHTYRYRELLEPYRAELEGELKSSGFDRPGALSALAKAREKLPPAEKLLLARSYAITGRLQEKQGDSESALLCYQKAYHIWPGLFRHLKIKLPVSINVVGSGREAAEIKKALAHSPRFRMRENAFIIQIGSWGDRLEGSLLDHLGNTMCRMSTARRGKGGSDTDTFLEEFHMKVFSAPLSASLSEINSLDGSNLKDDQMRGDLRELLFQKKK